MLMKMKTRDGQTFTRPGITGDGRMVLHTGALVEGKMIVVKESGVKVWGGICMAPTYAPASFHVLTVDVVETTESGALLVHATPVHSFPVRATR